MKILLVYPLYPDSFWSFRHALKFINRKASFPPLGLLTVAAMLPDERLFPLAITYAVYGFHFRKVAEKLEESGMFDGGSA